MLRTDELCAREQVKDREKGMGETMLGPVAGFLKYAEMDRYQNSVFLECTHIAPEFGREIVTEYFVKGCGEV
jgi:hypothetical protein